MRLHGPKGQPLADYIAEVAAELFYRDGITAVGVDRIAAEAGLTKRTIYKHYRSKDDLIAASLRHAPLIIFPAAGEPLERILGAFDALGTYLTTTGYRGCPYVFYTAELTEPGHPARRLIERRLAKRRAWFRDRLAEAGVRASEDVSEELDVLFDGAVASGAKRGDLTAAHVAARLARLVLDHAVAATRGERIGTFSTTAA